jgi:hypothetical protein
MAVERLRCGARQGLDHRDPEGEVRHEVVVHDVDVQPVGARDPGRLGAQVGEVRSQDAGRDLDPHGGESLVVR